MKKNNTTPIILINDWDISYYPMSFKEPGKFHK